MNKFILRWIINAIALYVATLVVPGIALQSEKFGPAITIILLALVFGLVNALIRPIVMTLTCPLIMLSLGLGTLLVNTAMFYLAGWIGSQFGWGFTVNDFWTAFLGALVVSVVSWFLSLILHDK